VKLRTRQQHNMTRVNMKICWPENSDIDYQDKATTQHDKGQYEDLLTWEQWYWLSGQGNNTTWQGSIWGFVDLRTVILTIRTRQQHNMTRVNMRICWPQNSDIDYQDKAATQHDKGQYEDLLTSEQWYWLRTRQQHNMTRVNMTIWGFVDLKRDIKPDGERKQM